MTTHLKFKYKSTPFWSTHICGMLVLCYQDSDLIVGVYSARFASGCVWLAILSYNAHAHTVLPWWSDVTDVSGMRAPDLGPARRIEHERSDDQLSELSIIVATYQQQAYWPIKYYAPETEDCRCYLVLNSLLSSLPGCRVSQLQPDRDNEGRVFIRRSNLDASTWAVSRTSLMHVQ